MELKPPTERRQRMMWIRNTYLNMIWTVAHVISLIYPENPTDAQKEDVKKFYSLMGGLVGCGSCKTKFLRNIKENPLTDNILSDQEKLFNWVTDRHNNVNHDMRKKVYSYQEVIDYYTQNDFVSYLYDVFNLDVMKFMEDCQLGTLFLRTFRQQVYGVLGSAGK